jgi:hypothetical protein
MTHLPYDLPLQRDLPGEADEHLVKLIEEFYGHVTTN